ncbi:MAG: hypothetical protein GPJ54_10535 [Candidatus Heimdallarchaeota archaeon]|nr:hypothetical protein [Candidatus Heimdallarchaeota archaeon]
MNKTYFVSGLNVVKSTLKVAVIIMILGIAVSTYAATQVDATGNYYEIGANQSQERYLGYFELGEDVQVGIGASFNENLDQAENRFTENIVQITLLHSLSRDFSNANSVFSLETSELYRDFSADDGYYKLIITNLTNENLNYVVVEAHSSTSMIAVLVFGLVLIGIGFAIIGMTVSIVFHVLMILGIYYIVKSVMENEQRKRKSPMMTKTETSPPYAGYMPQVK